MKNKKGNVVMVALIIAIVAITAGVIGWMFAKKSQAPSSQITTSQVNQEQVQKVNNGSTSINNNDSKSEEEIAIERIDRRKGEGCITSGPDERYGKLPPANESYAYMDPFNSISLNIPYNKNWKFDKCVIGPFTQFKDGDGVLVYFGHPSSWGPDQFALRIGKPRSIEVIQGELSTPDASIPKQQMKKVKISGLDAFRWQENGVGEMIRIEVIGKKYNYRFESAMQEEESLIKIMESIKLL